MTGKLKRRSWRARASCFRSSVSPRWDSIVYGYANGSGFPRQNWMMRFGSKVRPWCFDIWMMAVQPLSDSGFSLIGHFGATSVPGTPSFPFGLTTWVKAESSSFLCVMRRLADICISPFRRSGASSDSLFVRVI